MYMNVVKVSNTKQNGSKKKQGAQEKSNLKYI